MDGSVTHWFGALITKDMINMIILIIIINRVLGKRPTACCMTFSSVRQLCEICAKVMSWFSLSELLSGYYICRSIIGPEGNIS